MWHLHAAFPRASWHRDCGRVEWETGRKHPRGAGATSRRPAGQGGMMAERGLLKRRAPAIRRDQGGGLE